MPLSPLGKLMNPSHKIGAILLCEFSTDLSCSVLPVDVKLVGDLLK